MGRASRGNSRSRGIVFVISAPHHTSAASRRVASRRNPRQRDALRTEAFRPLARSCFASQTVALSRGPLRTASISAVAPCSDVRPPTPQASNRNAFRAPPFHRLARHRRKPPPTVALLSLALHCIASPRPLARRVRYLLCTHLSRPPPHHAGALHRFALQPIVSHTAQ
jgi:hypothetical protein